MQLTKVTKDGMFTVAISTPDRDKPISAEHIRALSKTLQDLALQVRLLAKRDQILGQSSPTH